MSDLRQLQAELAGQDRLTELASELQHRIALLEQDTALLFKAAGLAGMREQELLSKLGLSDDTLQRHNGELLAQIAVPAEEQR